jgi:MoxR-like ATPase
VSGSPAAGPSAAAMAPAAVAALGAEVLDAVASVVVGRRDALGLVLAAVLARGHVLLEDLPGLGKTLTARTFAQALGLGFRRVQFTPDTLPGDITGSFVYSRRSEQFEFRSGPVFTELLLADEVNRTPPRTQSALLEAMQEEQVTVEGTTFPLPRPFCVLATANPIEYEGTYPLPEAQLDRFLLRLTVGYPDRDGEQEVLRRRLSRRQEAQTVPGVVDAAGVRAMQDAVEGVTVEDSVAGYLVDLVRATRAHPAVLAGASPRGSVALLQVSRAVALLAGRDYVAPDDVLAVAPFVLTHRVTLRPETYLDGISAAAVVSTALAGVPAPATAALPAHSAAPSAAPTSARRRDDG